MKAIEQFISNTEHFSGYSVSKTITTKLVPIGKTRENIEKMNVLETDKQREAAFLRVKKYIDRIHKDFIEKSLIELENNSLKYNLDFSKLYELHLKSIKLTGKERKDIQKEIKLEESKLRNLISKYFVSNSQYNDLFNIKLFKEILPAYCTDEENEDVKLFDNFTSYFKKFNDIRKLLYSDEEIHNSIAYRIVNENFPIYVNNKLNLEKIKLEYNELYNFTENNQQLFYDFDIFKNGYKISSAFISKYNSYISGIFDEEGNQINHSLNQIINEYRQKNRESHISYFKPLYKNLMTDKKPLFSVTYFDSTVEIKEAVISYNESIKKPFERFSNYMLKSFPVDKWCIYKKNLNKLSNITCGTFYTLDNLIETSKYFNKNIPDIFSSSEISEILNSVSLDENEIKYDFLKYLDLICKFHPQEIFDKIPFEKITDLRFDKKQTIEIKNYLQSILDYYNLLRILYIDKDNERIISGEITYNEEFYSELELILDSLSPIVTLYNKVRNYVTKSLKQEKKIKLNFECSQFLGGWSESQEMVKNGLIFHDEEKDKYYLGIYNQNMKKPEIKYCENSSFKKMILNTIPEPYKMLPKIFFSKKGLETYNPSKEIIEGYKNELHKKSSNNFDINFCHKLIDYYKNCIKQRKEWNCFTFNFRATEEYQDTSEFFDDVSKGGYSLLMKGIDKNYLIQKVEDGNIFLFEIYNKYLAKKGHGKDIYTQIIRSALSGKDSNIQLCAGAQIYYRPALIKESITHKKGSTIVNKITREGFTINSDVYKNICSYFNYQTPLSSEAKTLLDSGSVFYKTADRDLYKDRRYMYENFSFHCPVVINWKEKEIKSFTFNKKVLEAIRNDESLNILSVNRGENNLVYAVLMNRNGKVLFEKSFNLIQTGKQNVNYKNKLIEKSKDRTNSRTNWQEIDRIKELKSGYLSFVVAEITRLMIDNNAVLVLESLSSDFKSGRQYIESNIYQQFEGALLTKLSCVVLKEKDIGLPGSLEHPYQLVPKFESFDKIYLQYGFVFFINPSYISRIDPSSGIFNFFNFQLLTNNEKRTEFFKKFESITEENGKLIFKYCPGNFNKDFKEINNTFKVVASGSRDIWNPKTKSFQLIDLELEGHSVYENLCYQNYKDIAKLFREKCNESCLPHALATERLLNVFMATIAFRTFVLDDWKYVSPLGVDNEFTGKSMDYIAAYNLANKFRTILELSGDSEYLINIKTAEYINKINSANP